MGERRKKEGKKSADLSKEGADLSVLKVLDPGRWRQASSWRKKGVKARVTLVVQRHRLSGWRDPSCDVSILLLGVLLSGLCCGQGWNDDGACNEMSRGGFWVSWWTLHHGKYVHWGMRVSSLAWSHSLEVCFLFVLSRSTARGPENPEHQLRPRRPSGISMLSQASLVLTGGDMGPLISWRASQVKGVMKASA